MIAALTNKQWNRRKIVRPAAVRRRDNLRWQQMAERRRAAGLTTRGTPRRRPLAAPLLLADVEALATAIGSSFHDLTPAAQVRALHLEMKLTAIRQQLIQR